jgi:DNA-binding NarL/FixJ family response regulator
MREIRISLFCNSPLLSNGIACTLDSRDGYTVLSQAAGTAEPLNLSAVNQSDILILALDDSPRVIDTIAKTVHSASDARVVVFSASTSIEHIMQTLDAGATGYLTHGSTQEELLECVESVLGGDTFVSPCIATRLVASLRTAALRKAAAQKLRLTLREEQIVALLRKGRTNKEMAHELALSEKTIKHYMTVLMNKLAARSRLEVVLTLKEFDSARTVAIPYTFN